MNTLSKKVADSETVWGLYEDGWAITEDDKGNRLFPVWPKKGICRSLRYWGLESVFKRKHGLTGIHG
ncbi:DUF2750 domain-containing protein [Cohnella ginsengisoli]|uniref:DUF2750 domain-containing protein n=1 Tax=Cohnella ginsengisoli TaxID=425004 RepID=A0A9X4KPS8_9BACL|nr:DUF2750 domain-containing protein [Cohnella ginsengisoli]MDG0793997.1 DUF2750 domain-containing protein [Cohnella ginsengisoli]